MKRILNMGIAGIFTLVSAGCINLGGGWTQNTISTTTANTTTIARSVANVEDPWAFDPGPSPQTPMGKELIDLVASQPDMPDVSKDILGAQKFRPAFGPTLWRMLQEPNSIKILFIGQDGTHIAEAAGRTATAGFGGRAQDMAAHFGVNTSAAFMNTFAFTIKKQYAVASTPVVSSVNGKASVDFSTVVDNGTWMMSQDQNSPMVKWRNALIDWIIRNNKDSLKMIVLFGGSAKDSIGTFIESRGGQVGARYTEADITAKNIKVPLFRVESAGANKIYPVMQTSDGGDVNYKQLLGKAPDYTTPEGQSAVQKAIEDNFDKILPTLAITNTGFAGSGVAHPAQIGGYNLKNITINGNKTISLKGLKLSDGSSIQSDILVAAFPHPTALSATYMTNPAAAEKTVEDALALLKPYAEKGWEIDADKNMANHFAAKEKYHYGRADIAPAYYDFGTPNNRMVSVSSASRMTGKPNVVVIGTREKAQFDMKRIAAAEAAQPAAGISQEEMFSARPRTPQTRYIFDRGPSENMAQIMTENIDLKAIGTLKAGYQLKAGVKPKRGETIEDVADVDGFNIKSQPNAVGAFGHYRGTFNNPKVIVLADPDGVDDILTSRALTGTRGQYLQGLMQDAGINDNYLVIKTVPFGMDGATDAEYKTVIGQTKAYREKVFAELLKNGKPALIIADGPYASQEVKALAQNVPVVAINRQGSENNSGIQEAAAGIAKVLKVAVKPSLKMANIPRSHLGFFSRVWEGTSGTHVFSAISPADKGVAYAIVVPAWAANQKNVVRSREELAAVQALNQIIQKQSLPKNGEGVKLQNSHDNTEKDSEGAADDGKPDAFLEHILHLDGTYAA